MRLPRHFSTTVIALSTMCVAPLAFAQSGIDIEIEQFGFGMFRPGGIVPVRLKLTSNLAESTGVWVQWQVPNADGDVGEYGRPLTVSPGQSALTWLYAPLSPNESLDSVWSVRVFEERDGERQGELGGKRISPRDSQAQMVDLAAGMIAIIGDRRMGLDDYGAQQSTRTGRPIGGHEDTRVASALKPAQLPDRWYGLLGLEALAWVGDDVPPQDLGIDQADAIREYVQRGGHLIISLPGAGNPWGMGAAGQTQLEDLLPCRTSGVVPRRDEAVPLSALLPVMCKTNRVDVLIGTRKEPEFSIRVFKDLKAEGGFNVIDNGFEPLLMLDDGRVIAVQKRFGNGRVTVIGIDLADGRLASVGLPQADVFWNRILGRRVDTPSVSELSDIEKAQRLAHSFRDTDKNMGSGTLFSTGINMTGAAGAGLLLALLLFVVYWLAAGASFYVLRQYKMVRHAWLAFAGCAAVFTVAAWGSVGLIPKHLEVQHVTVLDHIARPIDAIAGSANDEQFQRAVSFFSLYLPRYGYTDVAIERTGEQRDLLLPWTPPGETITPFPNTNTFRVDVARGFAQLRLPSRSTSTQLYAHWMGGLDPQWGDMLRVDPVNPIRVVKNAGGTEESLEGTIINELPGPLKDVTITWVKNNRAGNHMYARDTVNGEEVVRPWVTFSQSGMMLCNGETYRLAAEGWDRGDSLSLAAQAGKGARLSMSISGRYSQPFIEDESRVTAGMRNVGANQRTFMEMMGIFHQLEPPKYLRGASTDNDPENVTFHREVGRELDLSTWFTRPCVIITGFLEDVPSPVPLRIDGRDTPPDSKGLTMVRWIYPLPLDEEVAFKISESGGQPQ